MSLSSKQLSVLLQLSDSALPTGGFAHSFGLEQYLQRDEVFDEDTFSAWLHAFISTQLTDTDALLIRMLYEGVAERELADLVLASTTPPQVRNADRAMAKRLRAIGQDALGTPGTDVEPAHVAIEFGRISLQYGIEKEKAMQAHLTSAVGMLIQNAVRGIPLGQMAGQRVIVRARPWIADACETAETLGYFDFGVAAPGIEIAQMQHESLRARVFMS